MLTAKLEKHLREQLEQKRRRLLEELEHDPAVFADERPGYSNHMADDASEVYEQARDLALRQHAERQLQMVEHALEKLSKGTFGVCEQCGQPIDPARLRGLPQAMYCLSCQKRREE